ASSSADLSLALAHEAFHCFQFDIAPNRWYEDADWIVEGGAEWASATVDAVPSRMQYVLEYIQTPRRPSSARVYDAVWFWAHAADMSTRETAFVNMGTVLNEGSKAPAYAQAGGFVHADRRPRQDPLSVTCVGSSGLRARQIHDPALLRPGNYRSVERAPLFARCESVFAPAPDEASAYAERHPPPARGRDSARSQCARRGI